MLQAIIYAMSWIWNISNEHGFGVFECSINWVIWSSQAIMTTCIKYIFGAESETSWLRRKHSRKKLRIQNGRYYLKKINGVQVKISKTSRRITGKQYHRVCDTASRNNDDRTDRLVEQVYFDADSFEIGVDNRCSYTMTNNPNDFVGPINQTPNEDVMGINGLVKVEGIGTVEWKITNDNGMDHKLVIGGAMLVKSLRTRLLSPQHWAQVADDNYPKPDGTLCITKADSLVMKWDQLKYIKTLNSGNRVCAVKYWKTFILK